MRNLYTNGTDEKHLGQWTEDINMAICSAEEGDYLWEKDDTEALPRKMDIYPRGSDAFSRIVEPVLSEWRETGVEIPRLYGEKETELHGTAHVARVLLYTLLILNELPGMGVSDKKLLTTASVFHDVGRRTDYIEREHGENSAKEMLWIMDDEPGKYDFTREERTLLYLIIAGHCIDDSVVTKQIMEHPSIENKEKAISFYQILKDADALDRFRLGICFGGRGDGLDYNYLRLKESKRLVLLASEIFFEAEIEPTSPSDEWHI